MRLKTLVCFLFLICTCEVKSQVVRDSLALTLSNVVDEREKLILYLQKAEHIFGSDPLAALDYSQRASQLAKEIGNDSLLAQANRAQANALLHVGNYSQALDLYLSLVKYGEVLHDSTVLVVGYGNIGNVYNFQHDYENALKNYSIALNHFSPRETSTANLIRKANLLSNIGTIYDETKRFDEAEKYYGEALAIGKSMDNHEVIGNALNNTGTLHRDRGNDQLAIQYYREAYEMRKRHGNLLGMSRSCYSIGLYYFEHNVLDSAALYLESAIEQGLEIGALQTVSLAADTYYRVNKAIGNDSTALNALELSIQFRDSLFNEQTTKRIAQLEMQFQFDKKQSELAITQKETELYYVLSGSLLLLLFLAATVLFLLQKNKTRKAELKETQLRLEKIHLQTDLDKKDKELATNVTFLLSKNEMINSVSEKLLQIKQSMPAESQPPLQKLILDIQSNLQPDLWQEFEVRFQQVYENFFKVLTTKFPDLTPGERRLCDFLKLNMTTKEISALTYQNAKSIDVARTRLRKKLGLTGSDQNLVTFLEQLEAEVISH
jgi:tetratricopeptide (TPR) repeat protein